MITCIILLIAPPVELHAAGSAVTTNHTPQIITASSREGRGGVPSKRLYIRKLNGYRWIKLEDIKDMLWINEECNWKDTENHRISIWVHMQK
jgi:hypothetical protein